MRRQDSKLIPVILVAAIYLGFSLFFISTYLMEQKDLDSGKGVLILLSLFSGFIVTTLTSTVIVHSCLEE